MYTGRRCTNCRPVNLGIAPVIIAAAIPAVENLFSSLFGGTSETIEAGVVPEIQADLTAAMSDLANIATPGSTGYNKFTKIRCLAGDASVNQIAQNIQINGPFAVPPGCGYAHQDSRNYARSAVLTLAGAALSQGYSVPTSYVFGNASPSGTSTTLSASAASNALTSTGTTMSPVSTSGTLLPSGLGLSSQMLVPIAAIVVAFLVLNSSGRNR